MVDFNVVSTFSTRKILELAKRDTIQVGIVEGQTHATDGQDVSDIAKKLSFGTSIIPARPFLEEGMNSGMPEIKQAIEDHYRNIVNAKDFTTQATRDPKGLAKIGALAVGAVKAFVFGDYYRSTIPNAESTIYNKSKKNKKGEITKLSDKPLIDTGQMINSVTYLVNGKEL